MVGITDYETFQEFLLTGEAWDDEAGCKLSDEYEQIISITDTPDPEEGAVLPPGGCALWELLPEEYALHLVFDDIQVDDPNLGRTAPSLENVQKIIDFARLGPETGRMLVHCSGGVSRSSATALVYLCARGLSPQDAISVCLSAKAAIRPHRNLVALGDQLLGLEGTLLGARDAIWGKPQT